MCCIDKTPHKENASSYEQLANENGWNQIIRLTRESKTIPTNRIIQSHSSLSINMKVKTNIQILNKSQ